METFLNIGLEDPNNGKVIREATSGDDATGEHDVIVEVVHCSLSWSDGTEDVSPLAALQDKKGASKGSTGKDSASDSKGGTGGHSKGKLTTSNDDSDESAKRPLLSSDSDTGSDSGHGGGGSVIVTDGVCLRDISLSVRRGELICVVGTIGSGKSSLLSALCGELRVVNDGRLRVRGRIAHVVQQPWILGRSVKENVTLSRGNKPFDPIGMWCVLVVCPWWLESDSPQNQRGDRMCDYLAAGNALMYAWVTNAVCQRINARWLCVGWSTTSRHCPTARTRSSGTRAARCLVARNSDCRLLAQCMQTRTCTCWTTCSVRSTRRLQTGSSRRWEECCVRRCGLALGDTTARRRVVCCVLLCVVACCVLCVVCCVLLLGLHCVSGESRSFVASCSTRPVS